MNPTKRLVRTANQIYALWKLCLSYRKRDWELTDYPVVFGTQEPDPDSVSRPSRFQFHRHVASIVNWQLTGSGNSPEEALESLQTTFSDVKAKKEETDEPLPRPGTHVPLTFSSQERVNAHRELADDFIRRVLDFEWAWISDESSLWDFHEEETNDVLCARIREIYGVDVSDIESAKLWEIFERIAMATHVEQS